MTASKAQILQQPKTHTHANALLSNNLACILFKLFPQGQRCSLNPLEPFCSNFWQIFTSILLLLRSKKIQESIPKAIRIPPSKVFQLFIFANFRFS